ncbi:MAG: preprotein translocase subunit YajC [Acidimicrobiales bacterium]|nr:preprotein translocase subunit YajC [Acidimicrobiales bacterium]HBQ04829.1 preprotein translocase subunit YajC [Acidimicrobiaceae bacterium]HCJ86287.1 preprotein translocase subunit YajC [Acidimicrobiaceae bacterium]|tara:strand:+ start:77 stop:391 length:315 start_codon:yes stop_codon:yes gene_type:complete
MALLLPIIVFAGMYFLILRPQQKRMKEREAMVRAADIGDEVATVGGVIGTIVAEEDENIVSLEVDTDVELRVQRRSIGEIITKSEDVEEVEAADSGSDDADSED